MQVKTKPNRTIQGNELWRAPEAGVRTGAIWSFPQALKPAAHSSTTEPGETRREAGVDLVHSGQQSSNPGGRVRPPPLLSVPSSLGSTGDRNKMCGLQKAEEERKASGTPMATPSGLSTVQKFSAQLCGRIFMGMSSTLSV